MQAKRSREFHHHFPWAGRHSDISRKTELPHSPSYREKAVGILMPFILLGSLLGCLVSAGNTGTRNRKLVILALVTAVQWTTLSNPSVFGPFCCLLALFPLPIFPPEHCYGVTELKKTAPSGRELEVVFQAITEDWAQPAALEPLYLDELAYRFCFVTDFHLFWAGGGVGWKTLIQGSFPHHIAPVWRPHWALSWSVPSGECPFVHRTPSFSVLFPMVCVLTAVVIVTLVIFLFSIYNLSLMSLHYQKCCGGGRVSYLEFISQLVVKTSTITHNGDLWRQMPSLCMSSLSFSLQLYVLSMTPCCMGCPIGICVQLSLSPPKSLCTLRLLIDDMRSQKDIDIVLAIMKTPIVLSTFFPVQMQNLTPF